MAKTWCNVCNEAIEEGERIKVIRIGGSRPLKICKRCADVIEDADFEKWNPEKFIARYKKNATSFGGDKDGKNNHKKRRDNDCQRRGKGVSFNRRRSKSD